MIAELHGPLKSQISPLCQPKRYLSETRQSAKNGKQKTTASQGEGAVSTARFASGIFSESGDHELHALMRPLLTSNCPFVNLPEKRRTAWSLTPRK